MFFQEKIANGAITPTPPRVPMALTLPPSAAALRLLRRPGCAPSVSVRRRRRWQCAAARRDGRGAQLKLPGQRWLPPASPDEGKRPHGVAAAVVAGDAPYGGSKGKGSLWMVFLSTAVAVCGSFEFGTCVRVLKSPFLFPEHPKNVIQKKSEEA
jgi:MFS transporter, SP family, ERD6-like sugar transporter